MKKDDISSKDGKNGNSSHVIYDGKIYDVTDSKLWKNGSHLNRHQAGEDLTKFMSMAPHGTEVFEKFECIGEIEEAPETISKKDIYRRLYSKYHPHPIFLHYPMGLIGFSAFMLVLFLITSNDSFETAAFYSLLCGAITIIPTIISGIISWWINYEMALTSIFRYKLFASGILLILCTIAVILRLIYPNIATQEGLLTYIYYLSVFISVPTMSVAAYNGGKITWPS